MSKFRWLIAAVGGALLVVGTTLFHNASAHLQPPGVVVKTCDVSPAFGAFKGAWGDRLVFEDAAGTLRSVDAACDVRHTIRRE